MLLSILLCHSIAHNMFSVVRVKYQISKNALILSAPLYICGTLSDLKSQCGAVALVLYRNISIMVSKAVFTVALLNNLFEHQSKEKAEAFCIQNQKHGNMN